MEELLIRPPARSVLLLIHTPTQQEICAVTHHYHHKLKYLINHLSVRRTVLHNAEDPVDSLEGQGNRATDPDFVGMSEEPHKIGQIDLDDSVHELRLPKNEELLA
ncbi:hypothetical protein Trydic_g11422 [Trypoxylus dichotomus]